MPKEKLDEIRKICEQLGKEVEFAYILDHLEEERTQGITIDTTQIFFKTNRRRYVIIDAPGHREFTKNMVTGASQAEAAILIVDVTEGVQEQTKRHAYILHLLGLKQIIVAVNKMDLINFSQEMFEKVKAHICQFLKQLNIVPSYVIPISAKKGDNIAKRSTHMKWYDGVTVLEALDAFELREKLDNLPFRMCVQDVYKIDDKRIIVGKVLSGMVKIGDKISIYPSMETSEVVSVEEFLNENKTSAIAGESIGIVLKDKLFVDRGDIIGARNERPILTRQIKANVFWMSKNPLKKGERICWKCTTQEVICEIDRVVKRFDSSNLALLEENASNLGYLEVGEVILRFDRDIVIENFNKIPDLGRFVLDRNGEVVGGGIIVDI